MKKSLTDISVLVVDDDIAVLRLLKRILELEGIRVLTATGGEVALEVFEQETPDLVLLDIMMPDMDGFVVYQRIREFSQVPIIMVTAKGQDEEKVEGLNYGADDYLTKPFSAQELVARVKAVLRRTSLWDEYLEPTFYFYDLEIDFIRRMVRVRNREVNLTATEYRLLSYLARNAGRVVTTQQLLERVWGDEYSGENHILQVNIARIRQKLGDRAGRSRYIITRPGIGYVMAIQKDRR